jgi:hypothetical protein
LRPLVDTLPGVVTPGTRVPVAVLDVGGAGVVLAGGSAGVPVLPDAIVPGAAVVVPGVADGGVDVGLVGAGAAAMGAVVTVLVTWVLVGPEPPARSMSAAASTPSEIAITATIAPIGACQLGVAASRVRAAAPQCRHHS